MCLLMLQIQSHCCLDYLKINLKRKLQYKSSALSLNVRLHKVVQAAKWLINNSVLYKEEGIAFCENWQNSQKVTLKTQFMIKVSVFLKSNHTPYSKMAANRLFFCLHVN